MSTKVARLRVAYGRFKAGETVRGTLAAELIEKQMADDITPKKKPAKKAAPAKKAQGKAPENKAQDDSGFDPNAG